MLPTVLHFAAYYGLEKTVVVLIASEYGLSSIGELNEQGETPPEVAKRRGHDASVGEIFREYEGPISTWEAIQSAVNPYKSSHSFLTKTSQESGATPSETDTVFTDRPDSFHATGMEDDEDDDETEPESPLDNHYVNIQLVAPELPERTTLWREPSGIRDTYCFPVAAGANLDNGDYSVPPPPREALPAILNADNYIDLRAGHDRGQTLKHLNKNPIRAAVTSISTSDDEDDFPVYNRPAPLPPSVVPDQPVKQHMPDPDPWRTWLMEKIKQGIAKGLTWEEVADFIKASPDAPSMVAIDERNEKLLDQMREEYHQTQVKLRRETGGTGLLDRVVQGIKKGQCLTISYT